MPARRDSSRTTIHLAKRIFNRGEEECLRRAFRQLSWVETEKPALANVVWDVWLNDAEVGFRDGRLGPVRHASRLRPPPSADGHLPHSIPSTQVDRHASLGPGQVLNRFPAMADCCRKAVFATILSRLRTLLPPSSPLNDGRYLPVQFSLPRQKDALREHVQRSAAAAQGRRGGRPYYIVKPDSGSQGEGIRITAEPERTKCAAGQERVVQEYIDEPMLVIAI